MQHGVVVPRSWDSISADLQPRSPEGIPHWMYDTQTYTDNSTTELTFFTAAQNLDLTNLRTPGGLPEPQTLYIHNIFVDYLGATAPYVSTAAGGVTGFIDDYGQLHVNGRGRLLLTISQKQYGPWPLLAFPGLGAINGFGWGTFTAEESLQYGHNALAVGSGRGVIGGAIIIPPKVDFQVTITWPAALNITGDARVRVTLHGALYRKVA